MPIARNTAQVPRRVAIVIAEIGFDDEPMMPTMREDTVTNRNPNTSIMTAITSLPPIVPGMKGMQAITPTSTSEPTITKDIGRSRSVRKPALAPATPLTDDIEPLSDFTIVGIVRMSVMIPAIVTAPAPIKRT